MNVRVLRSIREIPDKTWDALCPDPVFSHGWLRVLEETPGLSVEPRHLALFRDGRLVGALPCFIQRGDPYVTLTERLLGPIGHRLPTRALLAYSPIAHRTELLLAPGTSREDTIRTCNDAMERICRQERIPVSGWLFVRDDDTTLNDALARSGHGRVFLSLSAEWVNQYVDFEGYLRGLRQQGRHRYRAVRNEINRTLRTGVRLVERPLCEIDDETLAALQRAHYKRHNPGRSSPFNQAFFRALKSGLGGQVVAHCAYVEETLVSYSLVLKGEGSWHMFLSGDLDPERAHADKLYFNLNYYFPIRRAIESGVTRLLYGVTCHDAKLRRGCSLVPVSFWLRAHSRLLRPVLPTWLALLDRHRRKRYAPYLGADSDAQ